MRVEVRNPDHEVEEGGEVGEGAAAAVATSHPRLRLRQPKDPLLRELEALRGRLGLTQEDFAHLLGVRVLNYNRWVCERAKPSPLARAYLQLRLQEVIRHARDDRADLG